jgi:hypothetical protein
VSKVAKHVSGHKPGARPHGQVRRSQLVTTFGPGAMLDLPNHSVLVAGLEFWSPGGEEVDEPRLADKLRQLLEVPALRLVTPPPDQDDPTAPQTGITAWQFPEWFITQNVESERGATVRSRMLVHRKALTKGKYVDRDKKKRPVVPVRFVRACRRGHIGDLDWYAFVHNGPTDCRHELRQLWMEERGTSGDLSEVWVRCECGKAERGMIEAATPKNGGDYGALGRCDGARPWLGVETREKCDEPNRLLIRTASNAYFSQQMSVISLPDRSQEVREAVDAAWDFLESAEGVEDVAHERKKAKVKAALEGVTDAEAFAEVKARKSGGAAAPDKSVKRAELEKLAASKEEIGEDRPDGDFFARTLPKDKWDRPWMTAVGRVVLVHRLREVTAQVGFTRFEAASPDIQGELEMGVRRAALARETTWLPAVENKGEGIFIQFDKEKVEGWAEEDAVKERGRKLMAGFDAWKADHHGSRREFPGLPYLMLHSFSHLLIASVSLECGYPASSIRERVYAVPGVGYGVLLFTGTPDAEGTLGGLVEVGRRVHEHVRAALEVGGLCSNDPACAQHQPENDHERRFLHGASCHGCLLIAETSCEQHNEFLDRALVVPTVENLGVEFFKLT